MNDTNVYTMWATLDDEGKLVSDGKYSPSVTMHFSRHERTNVKVSGPTSLGSYRVQVSSGPYPEDAEVELFLSRDQAWELLHELRRTL